MFHSSPARWLAAFHAMAALAAVAQPAPEAAPAAVAQPAPEAAPATTVLPYRSAFEGYRSYGEDKPIPWREANETVRSRGGWRGYAKEAAGADAGGAAATAKPDASANPDASAKPAAPAKSDAAAAHQGHTMPAPATKEQP